MFQEKSLFSEEVKAKKAARRGKSKPCSVFCALGFKKKINVLLGYVTTIISASRKDQVDFNFRVNHYAGEVQYDTHGFCEKNKDQLFQKALDLLKT